MTRVQFKHYSVQMVSSPSSPFVHGDGIDLFHFCLVLVGPFRPLIWADGIADYARRLKASHLLPACLPASD